MTSCVIIANGLIEDVRSFEKILRDADTIICADGGLKYLDQIKLLPTTIMGDFDSTPEKLLQDYKSKGVELLTFPKRKDSTDSELAIDYAVSLQPDEIIMLGMTGKRLDHGLTNLHMLKRIPKAIKASILDAYNKVFYCEGCFEYEGEVGALISIVPISEEVCGLTTKGLDYPLVDETLYFRESRGVSNVLLHNKIEITTTSGEFFIIISKD